MTELRARDVLPAAAIASAAAAFIIALAACGTPGVDRMDERYQTCIAAGGSFEKDDVDYSCTIPPRAGQ